MTSFKRLPENKVHQNRVSVLPGTSHREHSGKHGDESDFRLIVEQLPPVLRDMISQTSLCYRTPIEFATYSALAIHSAALGKGIHAEYLEHITRPNLYVILGMPSGSGKSETLRPLVEPLYSYQKEMSAQWAVDSLPRLNARKQWLENQIKRLDRDDAIEEKSYLAQATKLTKDLQCVTAALRNPYKLICEDASEEAFVEVLNGSGECTFCYSADAARPIENLNGGMKKGKIASDESHLLKAFSGDPVHKDRIGRQASSVLSPCASLLWVTTPERLNDLCANSILVSGGFVSRTLLARIDCPDRIVTNEVHRVSPAVVNQWHGHLSKLLKVFRFAQKPCTVKCSPAATRELVSFHNSSIESCTNSDEKVFARRHSEIALRIALNIHIAMHGSEAGAHKLSGHHAALGITVMTEVYHKQKMILGQRIQSEAELKQQRAMKVIDRVTNSEAARVYPKQFYSNKEGGMEICKNAEEATLLLGSLVQQGILTGPFKEPPPYNKRIYYVLSHARRAHQNR